MAQLSMMLYIIYIYILTIPYRSLYLVGNFVGHWVDMLRFHAASGKDMV